MALFNSMDSNEAPNGFSALAIGGAALLGLAGIGAASRAFKGAKGANWGTLLGQGRAGVLGRDITGGAGFGKQWNHFSNWITGGGAAEGQRLTAGLLRGGALAGAGWAGSYINPFVGAGEEGTLSGTMKTVGMGLAGASVYSRLGAGKGGAWNRFQNWRKTGGPQRMGQVAGEAAGALGGMAKGAKAGWTNA